MTGPTLSVVVPTYNGEATLPDLVERLERALEAEGLTYEVILVNDASPDDTWSVIEKLANDRPHVFGIDLLHNHGQHVATLCGMAHARGAFVATMDDDLQHPPEELPTLWHALAEQPSWDAVVGSWPRDQGVFRDLGSQVHAWTDRVAHGTPRGFRYTAFRLMRRPVVDAMVAHQTRLPVIGPLLTQVTRRVHNVPVAHDARAVGNSNFRLRHGIRAVSANFFQGSTLPLRLMSWFGVVVSLASLLVGVGFLLRYFAGVASPSGWLSAFLATAFLGGAILFQVGLLGQYVHLIVREVRQPPRWDLRATAGGGPSPAVEGSRRE